MTVSGPVNRILIFVLSVSRQQDCKRFNFGYRPDMSDSRIEVTSGHSPIVNSHTSTRRAFSPNAALSNEQPLADQPDVWGPIYKNRNSFVDMHLA